MTDITLRVKHNKRFSEFGLKPSKLALSDQVALGMEYPDHPTGGKVVLKCVSGESFSELQRFDSNTFGRCKFELDVIGEMEAAVQVQRREVQLKKEAEYRDQKAWDKWRFRGIQEGFCSWPVWKDAAEEWVKENVVSSLSNPVADDEPLGTALDDEALAKSLEETEAV